MFFREHANVEALLFDGRHLFGLTLALTVLTLLLAACGDSAAQPAATTTIAPTTSSSTEIKIGVIYANTGTLTVSGQDALRGVDLALAEFGGKIGDKKITLVKEATLRLLHIFRQSGLVCAKIPLIKISQSKKYP